MRERRVLCWDSYSCGRFTLRVGDNDVVELADGGQLTCCVTAGDTDLVTERCRLSLHFVGNVSTEPLSRFVSRVGLQTLLAREGMVDGTRYTVTKVLLYCSTNFSVTGRDVSDRRCVILLLESVVVSDSIRNVVLVKMDISAFKYIRFVEGDCEFDEGGQERFWPQAESWKSRRIEIYPGDRVSEVVVVAARGVAGLHTREGRLLLYDLEEDEGEEEGGDDANEEMDLDESSSV
eukprot:gene28054-36210_t